MPLIPCDGHYRIIGLLETSVPLVVLPINQREQAGSAGYSSLRLTRGEHGMRLVAFGGKQDDFCAGEKRTCGGKINVCFRGPYYKNEEYQNTPRKQKTASRAQSSTSIKNTV
jgi:hypothetical protein